MKKLLLFFSHKLIPEQIKAAKEIGIEEFVYLPPDLQTLFSNVPPDLGSLRNYAKPLVDFLQENTKKGDFALIQGDFGLCCILVNEAKKLGVVPVYATTKRIVKERNIDGKVAKYSEFQFVRFRRYE
ncbi:CRISPR-associated protein Csx20 [Nitratiruptor sp. YY09-18]|uniref:CRISPR-associated protein Csx20 n=1 Tax=Nitratiruptor sp. YY09-18 TaxID=2724901 RepID=UPI001916994D|nr:CRISPR-associated protein Csx20 [Nitratiruptor sp. YY09-18]BCD68473.1 hypothetical protein NitYY0918_C1388 [Nitratiruptor sp. YY09-18]